MNDFITSAFNIEPTRIDSFHSVKDNDSLNFYITLNPSELECPVCGASTRLHGKRKKVIKHPAITNFNGNIIWLAHRHRCSVCSHTFTEPNPFSFSSHSISLATERAILIDLKNLNLTYKDIADRHHVSSTTVQRLFDSWVNVPRLKLSQSIGIDEIHSDMAKYGSKYLCVIVDNVSRTALEILPSRAKHYLNNHFDSVPKSQKDSVLYVTIDMWEPYLDVAKCNFKNAIVAIDPFHVIKHLSDAFSRLRINIMNQVDYDSDTYYLLKKWLRLLETDVDLDNEPRFNSRFNKKMNYRDIYNLLLDINENLSCAYQLKEMYRRFNKEATSQNADEWFDLIVSSFISADISEYRDFVQLLLNWKPYIINSFLRPYNNRKLSNALSENINSQIRAYLAVSRGLSNFTRFRKRVLYTLNKNIFYSATSSFRSDKKQGKPRGRYTK